jgi:hypothetical protein
VSDDLWTSHVQALAAANEDAERLAAAMRALWKVRTDGTLYEPSADLTVHEFCAALAAHDARVRGKP